MTHPATSVWYSVDEEGNFKDEQETEIKKEKVSQLSQPPSSSRSRVDWRDSQASSSQSAGASSTARRLTTELRSVQGREEQGRDCWMQSAQQGKEDQSNWSDCAWHSQTDPAWVDRCRWQEQGGYHSYWRGGYYR